MTGLDQQVKHHALDDLAHRIMNGLRPRPGDAVEGVLAGAPVAIEQVAEEGLREAVT